MKYKRAVFLNRNYLGQVFQALFDVDVGTAGVGEDKDTTVQMEVDARRLDVIWVQGRYDDAPLGQLFFDGPVA